jgi:hypothetical protein
MIVKAESQTLEKEMRFHAPDGSLGDGELGAARVVAEKEWQVENVDAVAPGL